MALFTVNYAVRLRQNKTPLRLVQEINSGLKVGRTGKHTLQEQG
jgi:hypothetical protein